MGVRIQEAVSLLLVVVFIIVLLAQKPNSEKTAIEVCNSVISTVDVSELYKCTNSRFRKEFMLNPNDFDGVVYYASDDSMEVREFLLVRLKNDSQAQELIASIQKRVDDKTTLFGDYAPAQEALLKSHVLENYRGFVMYAVCDHPEQTVQVFKDSL